MKNKNEKVYFPKDEEIVNLLKEGKAICNKCGALMFRKSYALGCDDFVCPNCGWQVEETDYEYEDSESKMIWIEDDRGRSWLVPEPDDPDEDFFDPEDL